MNRDELVRRVAEKLKTSDAEVARVWDAMVADVVAYGANTGNVHWPHFGRFEWYLRKARTIKARFGYKTVHVPERLYLRWVPSRRVVDQVKGRT